MRDGIYESAQPFHTELIARLASNPRFVGGAYRALAQINTAESRAHLRRLSDEASDLESRRQIVDELSALSDPDSVDFLASLLPGRAVGKYDDEIRRGAVSGLVCIGGNAAAEALVRGTDGWLDQSERVELLSKMASRLAVDALVQEPVGGDVSVMLSVCSALSRLTHYDWCDDNEIASVFTSPPDERLATPVFNKVQLQWRSWWQRNRTRIRVHRADEKPPEPMPKIW